MPQPAPRAQTVWNTLPHPARFCTALLAGASLLLLMSGCAARGPEPKPKPLSAASDELLTAGTVGGEAFITNGTPQELHGFGLVIGLNGRGSSDCPTPIRQYLEDWLAKQVPPQGGRRNQPSPGELIDSPDTAVVEVIGIVPPGARKGARFDLQVRALAGTSTQSLEGGWLMPAELKYWDRANASPGGIIGSAPLAHCDGPLNISPFAAEGKGHSEVNPREATILGGGRTLVERTTKLMLVRANYALAKTIQNRINERFGQRMKLAIANSAQQVEVSTPPAYEHQYDRFRAALLQIYLDNRADITERRLRELATRAASPGADLERIAATWEAIGTAALPQIQPFYTEKEPLLQLFAARTGLRLGDTSALPVLQAFATSGTHDQRLIAIDELGDSDSPQTEPVLVPLLSDPDQEVRIAAYEALVTRNHGAIRSLTFPHEQDPRQINFVLDVVDSSGPPLIYVRRSRLPRIVIFGGQMPLAAPLFYTDADDTVTVQTVPGATDVQVYAKRGKSRKLTDTIVIPPRVVDLVTALADLPKKDDAGRLRGIGLPYSRVLQVLVALSKDETVGARLAFEQTPLTELLGPDLSPQRPEVDAEPTSQPGGKSDLASVSGSPAPAPK